MGELDGTAPPEAPPQEADPGRDARRPSEFPLPAWRAVTIRVFRNIGEHHLSVIAAGVAFFGTLSIFPALAAIVGIYGFFADRSGVLENLDEIRHFLPADAYLLIDTQARALVAVSQPRLGLASLVALFFAIWTARSSVGALIEGLDVVYREQDSRSLVWSYAVALALTMLVILIIVGALLATVAVPAVLQIVDFGPLASWLATAVPMLILGAAAVFVIGALYRYGPHRALARKRWVTLGAVLATVAWLVASLLLSLYISNFSNFNKTYGSLGAVIALMFWFYVSAFVVLLGAEVNAEMELQTRADTTTGPPQPIGRRGAYVADHVA